jgi:hypothetical protein
MSWLLDSNLGVCMIALYSGVGILAKMKEGAENVQTKLQARAEIVGFKPIQVDEKGKQFLLKKIISHLHPPPPPPQITV